MSLEMMQDTALTAISKSHELSNTDIADDLEPRLKVILGEFETL